MRIRGGEANHTLVLLNGVEVSDAVTGETDFGVFSGAGAGRVEVARGEQSALFGSDAIGGVVNVVATPEEGFRGLLEGGSRATYRLEAGYGWTFDAGDLSVSLMTLSRTVSIRRALAAKKTATNPIPASSSAAPI